MNDPNDAKADSSADSENVSSVTPTKASPEPYVHITPAEPRETALLSKCDYHPDATWHHGFGLAGGGFGSYKVCDECGRVFDKEVIPEDEDY